MLYKKSSTSMLLFLFGTFALTQFRLIGSIGISEAISYIAAPYIFIKDYNTLRRDGFLPVICLALMALVGCFLACVHNNVAPAAAIRGYAVVYSIFAHPIVLHRLLRNNMNGLKWLFLGLCLSAVINVFVFRPAVETSLARMFHEGDDSIDAVMNGPLFWLQRIGPWIMLPVNGWYYNTPYIYSIVAPFIMTTFTVMTTDSGRSAFAITVFAAIIIMFGRKKVKNMRAIHRHGLLFIVVCLVAMVGLKVGYTYFARSGLLNEKAQRKYEGQVAGRDSILAVLMGGRGETFAGLFACFDNPFWGFGPWSVDYDDYMGKFLVRYGDEEDYMKHQKRIQRAVALGCYPPMPSHSHIVGFWVRYGMLALPFWIYVLYCMIRHFRYNMASVPQWYGYLAIGMAEMSWNIIFSPYGYRVPDCIFITTLLLADAVRRGRLRLSDDMIQEVLKHDPTAH